MGYVVRREIICMKESPMDLTPVARKDLQKLLGDDEATAVVANVGWEQEFFAMDRDAYLARPDLVAANRMLVGAQPPRGQQTDFNYFNRMNPRVRAYMAKLCRDGQFAEELMQETMVAVWNKAALYSPDKGNVSTWIFTIARNQRIDHWRKANRPDFDPNDPAFVPAEITPADAAFDMNEDADRLHRAMETLPPEQLELLKLSFFEEASHGSISEKLGLPLGTVKSRIRLAFAKLRTALEDRS